MKSKFFELVTREINSQESRKESELRRRKRLEMFEKVRKSKWMRY